MPTTQDVYKRQFQGGLMKTYYKIGDVAKLYGVKPDSIRYYEEIGIITPQRAENGYRMFSIYDMWKLNVIRDLRALGFSMKEIRDYMENRTTASTIKLLEQEIEILNRRLANLNPVSYTHLFPANGGCDRVHAKLRRCYGQYL